MRAKLLGMATLCIFIFAACNGKRANYEVVNTSGADSTKIDSINISAANAPKLVKTADMRFKVKSVTQTSVDITKLTVQNQGFVMHHSMQSTQERTVDQSLNSDSVMRISSNNTTADMVIKIPSEKTEEFMDEVGGMAVYINNRNMDIQDKTLDYLSAQMKITDRKQLVKQQNKGRIKIKNPADVLVFKDDLIDEQINNRRIDDAVKFSTINLSFYQNNTIAREVIVNDDPSAFKIAFFSRLGMALVNGVSFFSEALLMIANLWLFIIASVAGWNAYRYYRRKKLVIVK